MTQLQNIKTEIRFSAKFRAQYNTLDRNIKLAFQQKLKLFQQNPRSLKLQNRSGTGKHKHLRSISIVGKTRAIYLQKSKNLVIFELIGKGI